MRVLDESESVSSWTAIYERASRHLFNKIRQQQQQQSNQHYNQHHNQSPTVNTKSFTMVATHYLFALLPLLQIGSAAITCLKIGQTATATWKNAAGQTCRWTGVVGSNFGKNSIGSEYVILCTH